MENVDEQNKLNKDLERIFHSGLLYAVCTKKYKSEDFVAFLIFDPNYDAEHQMIVDFLVDRKFSIQKITHKKFYKYARTSPPLHNLVNNYQGWFFGKQGFVKEFMETVLFVENTPG